MTEIIIATEKDIPRLAVLFDAYRVFYEQTSDLSSAILFLKERMAKSESVLFLALEDNEPVGFTQLYTTFSSVSMQPFYILNDLYVSQSQRSKGIGEALLNRAKEHCLTMKYKGLALETDIENPAQKLYERLGWKKDQQYFHYFWTA